MTVPASAPSPGEPENAQDSASPPVVTRDMIEYIADLILELKQLSERHGFPNISGRLDSAHREAMVALAAVRKAGH